MPSVANGKEIAEDLEWDSVFKNHMARRQNNVSNYEDDDAQRENAQRHFLMFQSNYGHRR